MTPTDAEVRKALDIMRIWISEDAHLGESAISYELERAEGLRKLDAIEQVIAATVGAGTCTMEPDGWYGEQYGIYRCSNCGELWQFECDGPREHGWTCCPKCRARIKEETE